MPDGSQQSLTANTHMFYQMVLHAAKLINKMGNKQQNQKPAEQMPVQGLFTSYKESIMHTAVTW